MLTGPVRAHLQLITIAWNHVYDGLNSLQMEGQSRLQFSNEQEKEYKEALPMTLLQLEVFSREEQPNYDKYSECKPSYSEL